MDAFRSRQGTFGGILGAMCIAGLLTGCAGSGSQPMGATPPASLSAFAEGLAQSARQRRARVFISDAADETIDILAYTSGKMVGQVTANLSEPQGLCGDGTSAWLANTGDSNLIRYSAAGKTLATLSDPGQYPVGCSVDAAGDIAVPNIISTSGGPGSVSIWTRGTGTPMNLSVPGMTRLYETAYDPKGDLFVVGSNASGVSSLAELVRGASSFKPFTIKGAAIMGWLQYAYGVLAVGTTTASGASVIYQVKVKGTTGKIVGSTPINDGLTEFCVTTFNTVIVTNAGAADVELYAYPAGGSPIRTLGQGFGQPIGCAIVD